MHKVLISLNCIKDYNSNSGKVWQAPAILLVVNPIVKLRIKITCSKPYIVHYRYYLCITKITQSNPATVANIEKSQELHKSELSQLVIKNHSNMAEDKKEIEKYIKY